MDAQEIFNEVLKSPKLKEILGLPQETILLESLDEVSNYPEIEIIKEIIKGQVRHTSHSAITQNITRMFINTNS